MKLKARMWQQFRQSGFFQADIVVIVEIVYTQHRLAATQQLGRHMRADKAGRSGDEDHSLTGLHSPLPFSYEPLRPAAALHERGIPMIEGVERQWRQCFRDGRDLYSPVACAPKNIQCLSAMIPTSVLGEKIFQL